MKRFDKQMAIDVIEDTLSCMDSPHDRGMAVGLCGAFYMCGLLSESEWRVFLKRIPADYNLPRTDELNELMGRLQKNPGRYLN
jgi:hypothetical protein